MTRDILKPLERLDAVRVGGGHASLGGRTVPEETAVALVFDGATHAVMMASPIDLEDFAVGFSITEGKVARLDEIREVEIVRYSAGIEARVWLAPSASRENALRRRAMLGPTGCGLCGIESLEAALPPVPHVTSSRSVAPEAITAAISGLRPAQVLNAEASALHAAAFCRSDGTLVRLREDVGRHNALDKLAGALLRDGIAAEDGIVVLTSRVSVEMVQKTAVLGAPVIAAVSAPTALAVRTAEAAGITLVGVARADAFEIFSHPGRILPSACARDRSATESQSHAAC